jgi:ACS family allantoate permease-like MFS transporter
MRPHQYLDGLQFIDKNSLTSAATYGIIGEAKLAGAEFSLLISIFYIGYLIAQYPTNILMQKFPTGKYLAVNFILWGATLAATGSATRFSTLAVGRFFLGVFESCLNPGFVLITSSWWKREEQTARVALWYCANGLIGAPSG